MSAHEYINMIKKLRKKTDERKTIWQKGSRDSEFSIVFKNGMFKFDKWYNNQDNVTYCDFQIYNQNGDEIYNTGPIDPSYQALYNDLILLHDAVVKCYYKVDEIIKGFEEELDDDKNIGDKPSEKNPSVSEDDIPF